ncbi:hypothetical protein ACHAW5_000112 [Stephanodiscus triporus]|uniref:Aminoglycoside phosphotransferase domain-containing protein n=1 Tax=Stephanodiscus triporus TaxID=2934178 RepID=A0ABD3NA61_9STRA
MTTKNIRADAAEAIAREFALDGDVVAARPYGAGHINDTFLVETDDAASSERGPTTTTTTTTDRRPRRYVLQRINGDVFRRPDEVMENVVRVCDHARARLIGKPDADRRALRLVPTKAWGGRSRGSDQRSSWWFVDDAGGRWRCYHLVPNATGHDVVSIPEQARAAARAFGSFQSLLSDMPPGVRLHETIPNFHDTPSRFEAFRAAVANDVRGRVALAGTEIDFAFDRERDARVLVDALRDGVIPERIAHNDAKIGNVLLDDVTHDGLCVVDLDTVMPGTVLYDFGDLVRTSTSPAPEDETDASRVTMRFDVFEALVEGYLESTRDFLTLAEKSLLPFSGKLITFEIGLRFLTDYLDGDKYFKVDRPGHNLDRARAQFWLVKSIEEQMSEMQALVDGL